MGVFNKEEAQEAKATLGGVEFEDGQVVEGFTDEFEVKDGYMGKGKVISGKIKVASGGFVFEQFDLASPDYRASNLARLGDILELGLMSAPASLDTNQDVVNLLNKKIPVKVELKRNKQTKKGYWTYYKNYQAVDEKLDLSEAAKPY